MADSAAATGALVVDSATETRALVADSATETGATAKAPEDLKACVTGSQAVVSRLLLTMFPVL